MEPPFLQSDTRLKEAAADRREPKPDPKTSTNCWSSMNGSGNELNLFMDHENEWTAIGYARLECKSKYTRQTRMMAEDDEDGDELQKR